MNDKPIGKPITSGTTQFPKWTIKDTVFKNLFGTPEYLFMLYKELHPEDNTAVASDLANVTINNALMNTVVNDLGFTVGNRTLILAECQSTWSANIAVRFLMYLAETWAAHINKPSSPQNIYGSRKVSLPKPEFYVIYTGKKGGRPEWLSLSEEFLDGALNIDLKVKIIYGGNSGGIIDQYISFTRILNRQIAEKGRTDEAVKEAIRICIDGDILREYLKLHEKEVISIMNTLFNQEYIARAWAAEERQIGRQEGRQEGRLEGRLEGERYMLFKLVKAGLVSLKDAAPKANLSEAAFAAQMDSYFTTVQ